MKIIFRVLIFLPICISGNAQVPSHAADAIPFATYSVVPQSLTEHTGSDQNNTPMLQMKVERNEAGKSAIISQVNQVDAGKLTKFVRNIRDTLCSSIGDADVKVWVSFDAQAKMLVVSANGQTGIEVVFHCK